MMMPMIVIDKVEFSLHAAVSLWHPQLAYALVWFAALANIHIFSKLKLQRNSRFFFRELFPSSVSLLLYSFRQCFAAIQSEELWLRLSFTRRHRLSHAGKSIAIWSQTHHDTHQTKKNEQSFGKWHWTVAICWHCARCTQTHRRRRCVSTIASFWTSMILVYFYFPSILFRNTHKSSEWLELLRAGQSPTILFLLTTNFYPSQTNKCRKENTILANSEQTP